MWPGQGQPSILVHVTSRSYGGVPHRTARNASRCYLPSYSASVGRHPPSRSSQDLLTIAAVLPRFAPSSLRSDRSSRRRSGRSDRARARLLVGACWRGLLIKMGSLSAAGAPGRVIPAARLEICDLSGAFLGLCVGAGGVVVLRFEGRGDGRRRGEVPAGDGGGAEPLGGVLRLHCHLQQGAHELPRL